MTNFLLRYYNRVKIEKRVFKNLQLFMENKSEGDDLFDRLNTSVLNKHLQGLMDGLTAKVFRTYNASKTLQEQLNLLTEGRINVHSLISYNNAVPPGLCNSAITEFGNCTEFEKMHRILQKMLFSAS